MKTRRRLPKLRKVTIKNKKHIYKLNQPTKKRRLAIDEKIKSERNKTKSSMRKAALAKKKTI